MKTANSLVDNNRVENHIPEIDYADIIQYAPNSPQFPQTLNERGQIIKGTALAAFVGYKHSSIDWKDSEGTERSVPKLALVFAVKLMNGSFKNIIVKTNYALAPGSNLEIQLKKLGVEPEYTKIVRDAEDTLFGTDIKFTKENREKMKNDLSALRGLAYLVTVENKQNPKTSRYYNDILLDTLTPRLGKDKIQMRLLEADKCDVHSLKINFDD